MTLTHKHLSHGQPTAEEIRKRGIRRTAWITSAIALAFYLGFIAMAVLRSKG